VVKDTTGSFWTNAPVAAGAGKKPSAGPQASSSRASIYRAVPPVPALVADDLRNT
jgi:hypothetical protein